MLICFNERRCLCDEVSKADWTGHGNIEGRQVICIDLYRGRNALRFKWNFDVASRKFVSNSFLLSIAKMRNIWMKSFRIEKLSFDDQNFVRRLASSLVTMSKAKLSDRLNWSSFNLRFLRFSYSPTIWKAAVLVRWWMLLICLSFTSK